MEKKYNCKNVSGHIAVNMSRRSLLEWINEELGVKIPKVEALCSGAEYCQLMDIIFPGCIQMRKIKFDASVRNEYWSNFKLLQKAFQTVGCEKEVPIDRLIEGRFQENFEFLQFFKRFYDANVEESLLKSEKLKQAEKVPSQPSTSTPNARPVAIVNPVLNSKQVENQLKSQIAEYQERARKATEARDLIFYKLRNIELLCIDEEAPKMQKKEIAEKILAEINAEVEYQAPEEEKE